MTGFVSSLNPGIYDLDGDLEGDFKYFVNDMRREINEPFGYRSAVSMWQSVIAALFLTDSTVYKWNGALLVSMLLTAQGLFVWTDDD